MTSRCKYAFVFLFSLLFSVFLFAENISDYDLGYTLDLPEGFNIIDYSQDGTSYLLSHPNNGVNLAIKINSIEKSDCISVLQTNLNKLKAESQIDSFKWNNQETAISTLSMKLDTDYEGWSLCASLKDEGNFITLICYSPADKKQYNEQFILSTINSLCVDMEKYNTPGPVLAYAFPKEGSKKITLNIAGKKISTSIDKVDEEASQFLVDLEYAVLCLYAKHDLWKEAWQRYYRMIYRDSFGRLENVSEDIYNTLYPIAHEENTYNANITFAQYLLSWVQTFEYKRAEEKTASDFTALPCALTGTGNDCDSRSLLLCVFLKSIGIESILLISNQYSHAMCVTEIEAPGQVYTLENSDRYFIYGETTAKVTWGMIAQDFMDQSKWIPVILP